MSTDRSAEQANVAPAQGGAAPGRDIEREGEGQTDIERAVQNDEPERRYDPTEIEVNRGREQGLGMGARDLARQRDPTVNTPAEDDDGEED